MLSSSCSWDESRSVSGGGVVGVLVGPMGGVVVGFETGLGSSSSESMAIAAYGLLETLFVLVVLLVDRVALVVTLVLLVGVLVVSLVGVSAVSLGEAGRLRVGVSVSGMEGWGGWWWWWVVVWNRLASAASLFVRLAEDGRLLGVRGVVLDVMAAKVWLSSCGGKPESFSRMLVGLMCIVPMVHCRKRL